MSSSCAGAGASERLEMATEREKIEADLQPLERLVMRIKYVMKEVEEIERALQARGRQLLGVFVDPRFTSWTKIVTIRSRNILRAQLSS